MHNPSHSRGWLSRLYVPVATLVLLGAANIAVRDFQFDARTAAQNPRLSFAGSSTGKPGAGFALVSPLFAPEDPNGVLTSAIPVNMPGKLSIFYLGNSQTISIMDQQPGDEVVAVWLAADLNDGAPEDERRFPLRLGSEPNLRMSEQLVKCLLSGSDPRHRVDVVIFGIVLDGLRWVDPREDVATLARDPLVRQDLEATLAVSPDLTNAARVVEDILGSAGPASSGAGGAAEGLTARTEDRIQASLDAALPLFDKRRSLNGQFCTEFLAVRNRLLGIRTDSRRPIPDGMYRTNLELVDLTLRHLARRQIHAIGYFAPIRPIEPGPYEPSDIVRFRKDFRDLCARDGAVFFDYSDLIPEEMWTNYPDRLNDAPVVGQRDFAHFTGRGHRRLGERIARDVRPWFEKWLVEKQSRTEETARMARTAGERQ